MSRLVRTLNWIEFDAAVRLLAGHVPKGTRWIYGVPRGGLPLAVALSHATGVPLSVEPRAAMVCVDDIADTGYTIRQIRVDHPDATFLAWLRRGTCTELVPAAEIVDGDEWLRFPWERWDVATAEAAADPRPAARRLFTG